MDESDWLDDGQTKPQKKVTQQPKEEPRGRGGRRGSEPQAEKKENREQPKREQRKEQKKQELQNNGEMSLWVLDALKEDQPPQEDQIKGVRGKPFAADMSYALSGEQLQPDQQINTSWMAPEKPQPATGSRGNRGNRDPPKQSQRQKDEPKEADDQQPAQRRGNREPAANFQKKRPYQDDRGSNYNNPRSYGEREQGGYRGRGRGRGRGNYQGGGYWGRQGQEQGNGRYRQSDNQGFKKRDNQQYKPRNFQTDSQSGSSRGNRNDNYQNRQYNNYGNRRDNYNNYRNDNREGGYNNSNNRNYNNRDRDREYNRDYNDNREYNNNRQQKEPSAFVKKPQFGQVIQPEPVKEPVKTVVIQKEEPLVPKGRRCWPESSIYILGCRLAVTYRPINQFRSKLMVIPYASLKMEYYPGNIINLSEVDYKARILAKGEVISSAGSVYLQKAISIGSFAGLAFLKMDEKRVDDSLKLGIKKLLGQVQQIEGAELNTIVFPICDQLGGVETVICSFLQNLQNCKKVKEVYITTNQADCFMDSMKIFSSLVQEMLDENKILIN